MLNASSKSSIPLVPAALVICVYAVLAQQPRDVAKPPSGSAVIEGTVVDEVSGRPLRRVSLELMPGVAQRFTSTDSEGRFVFTELPPGRYFMLRATRAGFVSTSYRSGAPIVLADGQHLTLPIKMVPGAVITGTVLDQGRPAAQTSVRAWSVRVMNGQRVLAQGSQETQTDDRGIYRLLDLPPGDYVLSAAPRTSDNTELRTVTAEEIKWAQQMLSGNSAAAGVSPGRTPPPTPQPVAYSTVFYPGTADVAGAATVTVGPAQERAGVDFNLQLVPTASVGGTVLAPDGQPPQALDLTLVPKSAGGQTVPDSLLWTRRLRPTAANGAFSVPGVPPGVYTIAARGASRSSPAITLWARTDVSVSGVDQSDIQLRLEPGMTLSGTLTFEDITQPPPTTRPRASVGLVAAPDSNGVVASVNIPAAQVAPDGTFTIDGVPPGRYFLRPSSPVSRPPGWHVKTARVGDVEASDHAFEVRPSVNIPGITIKFTNKTAEVSGTLMLSSGQVAPDYFIVLFSTDKAMWTSRSRRFPRTSRTGSDGTFRFADLLEGEWYLAALSEFDSRDIYNAEFLSKLVPSAAKVTLAEGEKKVQDLKILTIPTAAHAIR